MIMGLLAGAALFVAGVMSLSKGIDLANDNFVRATCVIHEAMISDQMQGRRADCQGYDCSSQGYGSSGQVGIYHTAVHRYQLHFVVDVECVRAHRVFATYMLHSASMCGF